MSFRHTDQPNIKKIRRDLFLGTTLMGYLNI